MVRCLLAIAPPEAGLAAVLFLQQGKVFGMADILGTR